MQTASYFTLIWAERKSVLSIKRNTHTHLCMHRHTVFPIPSPQILFNLQHCKDKNQMEKETQQAYKQNPTESLFNAGLHNLESQKMSAAKGLGIEHSSVPPSSHSVSQPPSPAVSTGLSQDWASTVRAPFAEKGTEATCKCHRDSVVESTAVDWELFGVFSIPREIWFHLYSTLCFFSSPSRIIRFRAA